MAYNKIGFHLGPGGRRDGIGDYMSQLDNSGIPFVIKSADDYGVCHEATDFYNANHVIVYRMSTAGQNDGYDYDVPDYSKNPLFAASEHWGRTINKLPPEFNKDRVWLEVINEVDKNKSNWLGYFGQKIAELAINSGYKVSLFGWSSGEPEKQDWKTQGMMNFLNTCQEYPQSVSVSLHEYSYNIDDIFDGYPYKVGRFSDLFSACEEMGISKPTTIITEWGWEYNNIPVFQKAFHHVNLVARKYAVHPEIIGAALWYLGGGFGNIATKASSLISAITVYTINNTLPGPEPEPMPDEPNATQNLLLNPSFEDGWWHKDGRPEYQIPNGWDIEVVEGVNEFDSALFVKPEVRTLPKAYIPEHEWPLFFVDGNHSVKIFKGNAPIKVKFFTKETISIPPGNYTFEVNINPDLVWKYENGVKVFSDDPNAGMVRFYKNGVVGDWVHVTYGEINTISFSFSIETDEEVRVGFVLRSPFPLNNNGWFLDSFSLCETSAPPTPEPPFIREYSRHVHLLPQDASTLEIASVLAKASERKQTLSWSVDDAFITHDFLVNRTVEVWDVDRVAGSRQELEDWVNLYYWPKPKIIYRAFDE